MKYILLLPIIILGNSLYSQNILFQDGFEQYDSFSINNFGGWTSLDLDQYYTRTLGGDPAPPSNWVATWPNAYSKQAFQIFEPLAANVTNDPYGTSGEIRNFDPKSGQKFAGSWAGEMTASYKGNEDWLISPQIQLANSGNKLSLWLKTLSSSYGDERFRIGIFSGTGNPTKSEDFTIISQDYSLTEPWQYAFSSWKEFSFDLDNFSNQNIRIGILCLTQQGSMLMVDDVKVTTSEIVLQTYNLEKDNLIKIYPNPAVDKISIISNNKDIKNCKILDTNGRIILNTIEDKIDISTLKSGIYFIQCKFENDKIATKKIIKK